MHNGQTGVRLRNKTKVEENFYKSFVDVQKESRRAHPPMSRGVWLISVRAEVLLPNLDEFSSKGL